MRNNFIKILAFILLAGYSNILLSNQYCLNYIPNNWGNSRYIVKNIESINVVIDKQTNLMWIQCTLGLYGDHCELGEPILKNWREALQAANNARYGKMYDWRVPNINELKSMVNTTCGYPSINSDIFPNTPLISRTGGTVNQNYNISIWSSSPMIQRTDRAWAINFEVGYQYKEPRTSTNFVRLVRSINN